MYGLRFFWERQKFTVDPITYLHGVDLKRPYIRDLSVLSMNAGVAPFERVGGMSSVG